MNKTEDVLKLWEESLCKSVDVGGLISRNPIAHKWKATFRALVLRETVAWRTHDLLKQSCYLHAAGFVLGARILIRSAFETLAILVYLNQLMRKVVDGLENFHEFGSKTSRLLLGSKDKSTGHEAVNILTVLRKCNERFPGIESHYASLSESAHPNCEGTCVGYSVGNEETFVTTFSNKWASIYGSSHMKGIDACIAMFVYEYNEEWSDAFGKLEEWIVANDDELEATKNNAV